MDGFFEILMMVIVIWVFSRGARKKKRQSQLPGGDAEVRGVPEERGPQKQIDWDEAIGDVLEGFGLPRPEQKTEQTSRPEQRPGYQKPRPEHAPKRSGAEAQRRAELARQMELQRAAEAGRSGQRARSSDLAEIAGLAEAAARRRAGSSESPASVRAARWAEAATPDAETLGAAPPTGPQPSTGSGLKKLEGLSELERAIIYAEILGPPKALQSDGELDS